MPKKRKVFPGETISWLIQGFEKAALKELKSSKDQKNIHDRLFAGLMGGFDFLQEHRVTVKKLAQQPILLFSYAPELSLAMRNLVTHAKGAAGLESFASLGLTAVFLGAARLWLQDNSKDMAVTMAALDRYLQWYVKISGVLLQNSEF
ncbi:MAG: hypothetical protein AB7G80_05650 [Dongiaceae bacterium]